jgi:hypothetical protein
VGDDRSGLYKAIAWEMYALARPGANWRGIQDHGRPR